MTSGPAVVRAVPLVLVGPMGSGKSTVGRLLAVRTGAYFVDIDAEIERRAQRSVAEIFAENGEEEFRRLEAAEIQRVLSAPPANKVVALGGGAVTSAETRALLADCTVVWLRGTAETLLGRLSPEALAARPLLREDPLRAMQQLEEQRRSYHQQVATHVVDVDDRTPAQVAALILETAAAER